MANSVSSFFWAVVKMNFLKTLTFIPSRKTTQLCAKRNFGACSVLCSNSTATDPIQRLFHEKLKEYVQKSQKQGGAMVDATPEVKKELDGTLLKLKQQYGADKDEDFTKFPSFSFPEPKLDPINLETKQ